jgi:beta-glucosidase
MLPSLPLAAAMAIAAGCDLNCGGTYQQDLKEAVSKNLIGEDKIGTALIRVMTVRHLLGLFDPPEQVPYTQIPFTVVESDAHQALALEAARQSLVLLKNDAQFLPLDKANLKKVAVIGPMAGRCYLGGYSGAPTVRISPVQGIADHLGVPVFRPSISVSEMVSSNPGLGLQPSSEGRMDIGSISDGNWAQFPKIDFSGKTEFQARVASASSGGRIEVHLDKLDGPLACTLTVPPTGDWQKWIDVSAPLTGIDGQHSVFLSFHGGSGFLLNIERFQLNPVSTPADQPGRPVVVYAAGCSVAGPKYDGMIQEAVEAARDADVVVMVCGIDEDVGAEQIDRATIGLTGAQPELIQAIYAVNPKIVLVLSSNNTLAVEWEQEHLPAILCALCAGQAQGTAIAEVLFGDHNPGGKLPCTWYRSVDQLPSLHDYDIHKGRTYMYFEGDPLYPFGHGLSYTTFSLDKLQITPTTLGPGEKTVVSATVTNTGKRPGVEVVQLYITPPPSPVKRPQKQLAGFQRVELQAGEQKNVTFELPFTESAFWYWDEGKQQFVSNPGIAKVLVGNSSANPTLTGELSLKAS